MAEVIGLVASVASLVAFTSETSKACNKLAKTISFFTNAPGDVHKISAEILDLAQILDLFQSVLQPLRDGEAQDQGHVDFIERSLTRVRDDVQKIADLLLSVQSKASGRNTRGRAKWVLMKEDVASMMGMIDKQKQTLSMQVNMLNLKIARMTTRDLQESRKDMKQVGSRVENLTEVVRTSTSESVHRIEDRIQSSTTTLANSIREEIHRTMSSIPRETNISRASLETLSLMVTKISTPQFESLTFGDSSNRPRRRTCTERDSTVRVANGSQTDLIEYATAGTQVTSDEDPKERPDRLRREQASSRLTSRTSVQRMTGLFGTVVVRRSTVKLTFPDFDPEFVPERVKVEIDFLPATWLQSWTGCGMFLARMGFGTPKFEFSFAVARIVDQKSDPLAMRTLDAVRSGDLNTLKELFQLKLAYPTDRDITGYSLLAMAARWEQLDICKLLLQQGAAVDINTPDFHTSWFPIEAATAASMSTNNGDFVRLYLNYDADVTMIDGFGRSIAASALEYRPLRDTKNQETESLFRILVENDPLFDIHQRDWWGRTLLMQATHQPRQIYEELLRLGADPRASDEDGSTVLHHFFRNNFDGIQLSSGLHAFLGRGEILALLIQKGADPQASNRYGEKPQDVVPLLVKRRHPLKTIFKWINLAFWHQALQLCGLSRSKYCNCHVHHKKKISCLDFKLPCQPCPGRFDESLGYDTFEEEMSAALRRWDKVAAQKIHYQACRSIGRWSNDWDRSCEEMDEWVQEVLIELEVRQSKAKSGVHADPNQAGEDRSEGGEEDNRLERDETQISDEIRSVGSTLASRDFDSDEDWETSSSVSSEEDWESAPET